MATAPTTPANAGAPFPHALGTLSLVSTDTWNHKRVDRVYQQLGLNLPRRTRRRLPTRLRVPLEAPPELNRTWTLDSS